MQSYGSRDQQLVHTPFVLSGYWSPCAPLETLDLGFVLPGTSQQGVPVILRELVLPGGFDPLSPSFTVRDVTIGLSGFSSQYETKTCCRLVLAKLKSCHNI
ncbi:unnamed protein product [Schistosoma mattheei]|uniref:Uncharacterized protein n=1 Tax=Schistosoma mattheei TaxID=31246 RepID=A0A183NZ77_9TREM|nr:unnamed protein product [Schistosoma mattheei]